MLLAMISDGDGDRQRVVDFLGLVGEKKLRETMLHPVPS